MSTNKYSKEDLVRTGIYVIICRETGKRYIGSTAVSFYKRWADHKKLLRKGTHHSPYLQNAWNKYTEFAFDFIILEFVDPEYCLQREQWWMDLYGSYLPENGYNASPTAGSNLGVKYSEETRRKMSEANKGRVFSEEHRSKLSQAGKGENHHFWGKQHTEETKRKISEANKGKFAGENNPNWGKNLSEETRKKISDANKGKSHSEETKQRMRESLCKYIYTLISPGGTLYETENLKQFAKEHNLHDGRLSDVLKGKQKQHKGWHTITKRLKDTAA